MVGCDIRMCFYGVENKFLKPKAKKSFQRRKSTFYYYSPFRQKPRTSATKHQHTAVLISYVTYDVLLIQSLYRILFTATLVWSWTVRLAREFQFDSMTCRIAVLAAPWGEHRVGHIGDSSLINDWTYDVCFESAAPSSSPSVSRIREKNGMIPAVRFRLIAGLL